MAAEKDPERAAKDLSIKDHGFWQSTCGNLRLASKQDACAEKASNTCKNCHLIKYCSKECQAEDWATHRADCRNPYAENKWSPRWMLESRNPDWMKSAFGPSMTTFGAQKYLWGNIPALDIMKIDQNEGPTYNEDLGMCFAASGDIRNMMMSVLGLPDTFHSHLNVVLNDIDFDVVLRNFIMLSIALQLPSNEAADVILHIWYSARIPTEICQAIEIHVLPLVEAVVKNIENKSSTNILSKTWNFGSRSLRLSLLKSEWQTLARKLAPLSAAASQAADSSRVAIMLAPTRRDCLDRALATQGERHRQCTMRFRETGVLLPFSHDMRSYCTPNPTLFDNDGNWQLCDSSDPQEGWSIEAVLSDGARFGAPKSDIYGALYCHVLSRIDRFCQRIATMNVTFHLVGYNAMELPRYLRTLPTENRLFDRIEVSNIVDRCYLGLERTLTTLGPWLKPAHVNPRATLIALFINAVQEVSNNSDLLKVQTNRSLAINTFMPRDPAMLASSTSPAFIRYISASSLYADFEALFQRYMKAVGFGRCGRAAGMKMRENQTIVEPWPLRLDPTAVDDEARKKFDLFLASPHTGNERYVEWIRVDGE